MVFTNEDRKEIIGLFNEGFEQVVLPYFVRIDERFDRIDERLDRLEDRMDKVEARLDRIEERLDRVEERLDKVEIRLGHIEDRLGNVEERLDSIDNTLDVHGYRTDRMEGRLDATIRQQKEHSREINELKEKKTS